MRTVRFPYTKDTYNNPQNVWTFAYVDIEIFHSVVVLSWRAVQNNCSTGINGGVSGAISAEAPQSYTRRNITHIRFFLRSEVSHPVLASKHFSLWASSGRVLGSVSAQH